MPNQPTADELFNEAVRRAGADFGLNDSPLNFTLEENEFNRTYTASATFDNDPRWTSAAITDQTQHMGLNVYHDFSVDFNHNDLTDITEVSISGPLKARGQTIEQKIELLEDWLVKVRADSQNTSADSAVSSVGSGGLPGYLYHEANIIYTKIFGVTFPLNFHPKSFTFSKDSNNATYNLSATFDNRDVLQSSSITVDERGVTNEQPHKITYSVNIAPSLNQYRPNASFNQNGWYVIYDIKSKSLERVSIDITSHEQPDVAANVIRDLGYIDGAFEGDENATPRFNYINSVLENLGAKYLTVNCLVESENSSENNRTQTYSLSQKYVNKTPKALSLTEGESYVPVFESRG